MATASPRQPRGAAPPKGAAAKRFKKTRSGVCLVYQVLARLSPSWRHYKAADWCGQVPLPEEENRRARTKVRARTDVA